MCFRCERPIDVSKSVMEPILPMDEVGDAVFDELPELPDEIEARGKWYDGPREVSKGEASAAMHERLGRPKNVMPEHKVTLRLDQDLMEKLKSGGPGWQTRANGALRAALALPDH